MTTAEIAEKSGIPEPTLEKLFAGKTKRPTLQTVTKLAHLFGCTLDDLQNDIIEQKEIPSTPDESEVEEIENWLTNLLVDRGYIRRGEDISDRDADFLIHWVGILDAWFKDK